MASPPTESTRRQLALSVIECYNSWNIDRIMSFRASNCIHQVLPSSLSRVRPPLNNSEFRAHLSSILPHFRHFHATVHDIIEDSAANKVVIWVSSTAETDVGPYANEYIVVLHIDSEGKVERFMEFVDSATSVSFFGRLNAETVKKARSQEATLKMEERAGLALS